MIELAGRTCYKSEDKITEDSAKEFVARVMDRGHLAVIEHASASYRVICDRGVTHEIVRHRLFSYCQESTRYCNYKGKVTFVIPPWLDGIPAGEYRSMEDVARIVNLMSPTALWLNHLMQCARVYDDLLSSSWTPQQARSVLPNALKTEIVMTANLREWLHFFTLRTAKAAHPQMREVAAMLLADIRSRIPVVFDGVKNDP